MENNQLLSHLWVCLKKVPRVSVCAVTNLKEKKYTRNQTPGRERREFRAPMNNHFKELLGPGKVDSKGLTRQINKRLFLVVWFLIYNRHYPADLEKIPKK